MAEIIKYNNLSSGNPNQCFCQMKFDDGLKILVSQSKDGIKIFKLFIGFVPIKTLFQASFLEREKHKKFMDVNIDSSLLLDSYVETIKPILTSNKFYEFLNF
ncbi:MAG: hypothetical protein HND39_12070 [Ignavibacteriota bacterium]|nr:hypothetical protein [Ignavibacteriota bacterium]QKJ96954.1 MAG: hypothetical protein HND39_12070 [Ignavibacteriota bacterium]GIK60431.1 MAG: hypothetical protein BroJett017_13210 [Ignavibacteriota bacterium]